MTVHLKFMILILLYIIDLYDNYIAQTMKQALSYSKKLFSEAFQNHCLSFSVFHFYY